MKSITGVHKLFLIDSALDEELFSLLQQRFLSKSLLQLQISDVVIVSMELIEPIRMEQLHKISFHHVNRSTVELILNIHLIALLLQILEFKPREVDPFDEPLRLPFTNRYSNKFPKLRTFRLSDSEELDKFLPTLQTCKRLYCDNSLYDEDLEMLKAPYKTEHDTDVQWLCPKLYAIEILTCVPGIHELLREVVHIRQSAVADASGTCPVPIMSLKVTTSYGLAEEDRDWFQQHPKFFRWTDGSS